MTKICLTTNTLAVLIAGLYATYNDINLVAIPSSLWFEIAEKLELYLDEWDYDKISFEDWVKHNLFIYPTSMLDHDTLVELMESTIYFERMNGNVLLSISMEMD